MQRNSSPPQAHDQVVGAHVALEARDHPAEQPVAGTVAEPVVDRLEPVDVHEGREDTATGPPRPVDLALQLVEPDTASASAGELVGVRLPAVVRGLLAVLLAEVAVVRGPPSIASVEQSVGRRLEAVVGRSLANRSGALLHGLRAR